MKKENIQVMPFFYDKYIGLVSDKITVLDALRESKNILEEIKELLNQYQNYQYQEGKWTPKVILQHIIDTERIMTYRALSFARGEQQELAGFDENKYADTTIANQRTIDDLLQEFKEVRNASVSLFKYFSDEMLQNKGVCSGINVSPLILGFVCVGHAQHHVNVLHKRYFNS